MNTSLCQIARKYGLESGPDTPYCYTERLYPFFETIREKAKAILEIGVRNGISLKVWGEFFPYAEVHGLDIDPSCAKCAGDRTRIWIGDQTDKELLITIGKTAGPFDLIIDDGSHRRQDQLMSFYTLFPYLNVGGFYLIEDTFNSYNGEGGLHEESPIGHAKDWIDAAQLHGWTIRGRRDDGLVVATVRDEDHAAKTNKPLTLSEFDKQIFAVYISLGLLVVQKGRIATREEIEANKERLFSGEGKCLPSKD